MELVCALQLNHHHQATKWLKLLFLYKLYKIFAPWTTRQLDSLVRGSEICKKINSLVAVNSRFVMVVRWYIFIKCLEIMTIAGVSNTHESSKNKESQCSVWCWHKNHIVRSLMINRELHALHYFFKKQKKTHNKFLLNCDFFFKSYKPLKKFLLWIEFNHQK